MPELRAGGFAELVANEAFPAISDGPGQLVTATFAHGSAQVLDLVFEPMDAWAAGSRILASSDTRQAFQSTAGHDSSGSSLTLGVTAAHPFWSMTRDEFVPAGEMELGEQVVALEGQLWRLTSITSRAGPESVYNFEVASEHVYYVGSDGLLVHNLYVCAVLQKSSGKFVYVGKGATSRVNTALKRTAARLGNKTTRGLVLKKIEVPDQFAARGLEQRLMNAILKRQGGNLTKRGTKYAGGGNLLNNLNSWDPARLLLKKSSKSYQRAAKFDAWMKTNPFWNTNKHLFDL
jgi:hypothetical protein